MSYLSEAILYEPLENVQALLNQGEAVNVIDAYGYSPLIEAIIMGNMQVVQWLLDYGADVNFYDVTGTTPLFWAVDSGRQDITQLLLQAGADPNRYGLSRQPPLVYPLLREQHALKKLLLDNHADLVFAQDFIYTKLLAHRFELLDRCEITDHEGRLLEIEMEGFFLESTLTLVQDSLSRFMRHYVSRQLRDYIPAFKKIVEGLSIAAHLQRFAHYTKKNHQHEKQIYNLLSHDFLVIPISYEGHAMTCLHQGQYFVKCDRGEHGKNHDTVVFYRVRNVNVFTLDYVRDLIYAQHRYQSIHRKIEQDLGLEVVTTLEIPAQLTGNCSWANVEAVMPCALMLFWLNHNQGEAPLNDVKAFVLDLFEHWQQWDKDVSLTHMTKSFHDLGTEPHPRKAAIATLLVAILVQQLTTSKADLKRADKIIPCLMDESVRYILETFIEGYCRDKMSPDCKRLRDIFDMLDYNFPRV